MSHAPTNVAELELDVVARLCSEQTEQFFRKQGGREGFCFELFRRALLLRHEPAWEHIYTQYRSLVIGWIQRHPAFSQCHEDVQYFVNGAFARFWRWCTPEKFPRFDSLSSLLAYLKACVYSELAEYHRRHVERSPQTTETELALEQTVISSSQSALLDQEARQVFWQLIQERVQNEQERLVLKLHFVLGYKPRDICGLHGQAFEDVRAVYRVKDNLLRRLRRDPLLRAYFAESTRDE